MIRVFMWKPLANSQQSRMKVLGTQEGFMIYIKASIVAGIIFSSPFVFYFLWQFVAAGLYPHERKYVHFFMPMSIGLFLAGAALAFFVVFKYVLDFLLGFNAWLGLDPELRISEWMSFVLLLPIGFGISFQLPLVMLFLERIGVFNTAIYLAKWRIAVLVIAVISMVLTPADPISMILMAAPLTVLYFGGIALCHFLPRGRGPFAELLD
jgi:sec-independent protein translocase protein TatC